MHSGSLWKELCRCMSRTRAASWHLNVNFTVAKAFTWTNFRVEKVWKSPTLTNWFWLNLMETLRTEKNTRAPVKILLHWPHHSVVPQYKYIQIPHFTSEVTSNASPFFDVTLSSSSLFTLRIFPRVNSRCPGRVCFTHIRRANLWN